MWRRVHHGVFLTFLYLFSGVLGKTEADPLAELQWASADQSPAQRREGSVFKLFESERSLHESVFISWLLSVSVSVWQWWLWQPGVQRGGGAQEEEDRGIKSESTSFKVHVWNTNITPNTGTKIKMKRGDMYSWLVCREWSLQSELCNAAINPTIIWQPL